jgi:hypothetical protein
MLRFMVLSAPRSGSAWCANWLSGGTTLCLHDPLWDHDYRELDAMAAKHGDMGVACTGLGLMPEWVNAHPCPKVILHRSPDEVKASLAAIGLPWPDPALFRKLWEIDGLHVQWSDLFTDPGPIHWHLRRGGVDFARHKMLRSMRVTSKWAERSANHSPRALAAMKHVLAGVL